MFIECDRHRQDVPGTLYHKHWTSPGGMKHTQDVPGLALLPGTCPTSAYSTRKTLLWLHTHPLSTFSRLLSQTIDQRLNIVWVGIICSQYALLPWPDVQIYIWSTAQLDFSVGHQSLSSLNNKEWMIDGQTFISMVLTPGLPEKICGPIYLQHILLCFDKLLIPEYKTHICWQEFCCNLYYQLMCCAGFQKRNLDALFIFFAFLTTQATKRPNCQRNYEQMQPRLNPISCKDGFLFKITLSVDYHCEYSNIEI